MHLLLLAATTLLISFDGLRPDQITPQSAPNIYQLKQEGASAKKMEPIFLSSTFPNHASLMTGCTAEEHGIVSNHFFDAKRGLVKKDNSGELMECEPIWAALVKAQKKVAVVAWPFADEWHEKNPTYFIPFGKSFGKKGLMKKQLDEWAQWRQFLAWLKLSPDKRPELIMGYFPDIDSAGHRHGPFHPKTAKTIQKYDRMFAWFLNEVRSLGLSEDLNIVLVSDHGMALATKPLDIDLTLDALKEKLPKISWKMAFSSGTIVNFYLKDKNQISALLKELKKIDHVDVFAADQFPQHWHYQHPRSGDIILTAKPPYFFRDPKTRLFRITQVGVHGYDPKNPDMQAFFAARGPAFKKIELDKIRTIDIAPTVAEILGISLNSKKSGRAVSAILR